MSDWAVRLGTTQRRWGRKRGASLRIARSLGGALVFPSYSHRIRMVFSSYSLGVLDSQELGRRSGIPFVFASYSHGVLFVFSWCFAPGEPSGYQEHRGASTTSVPELETADLSVMRIASCHARARGCLRSEERRVGK